MTRRPARALQPGSTRVSNIGSISLGGRGAGRRCGRPPRCAGRGGAAGVREHAGPSMTSACFTFTGAIVRSARANRSFKASTMALWRTRGRPSACAADLRESPSDHRGRGNSRVGAGAGAPSRAPERHRRCLEGAVCASRAHDAPVNVKQADVIEGACVLANARGTAPGQRIEAGARTVFLLPGPPARWSRCSRPSCSLVAGARGAARHPHARPQDRGDERERRRAGGGAIYKTFDNRARRSSATRASWSCTSWRRATRWRPRPPSAPWLGLCARGWAMPSSARTA